MTAAFLLSSWMFLILGFESPFSVPGHLCDNFCSLMIPHVLDLEKKIWYEEKLLGLGDNQKGINLIDLMRDGD